MDIKEYRKILEDPAPELEALRRRAYARLEDGNQITNHETWHFVFIVVRQLSKMAEEWDMAAAMASQPSGDRMDAYYETSKNAKRVLIAQMILIIREELDNLAAKGK